MKVLIVEDEYPALERMKVLVANSSHRLDLVGEASSGAAAIASIEAQQPEAIFLDIHLMDMTGFEVLSRLQHNPFVIFTTAYQEYALKAFEYLSVDYLLKPFNQSRFDKAVSKLMDLQSPTASNAFQLFQQWTQQQATPKAQTLAIKDKDRITLVPMEDIAFLKAEDKYVKVCLANGKQHLLTKTLSQLELELPDEFLRVHRSYIVHRAYVYELQRYFKGRFVLKLNDKAQTNITSSDMYAAKIKASFGL